MSDDSLIDQANQTIENLIKIKDNAYKERNIVLAAFAWMIHNSKSEIPACVYLSRHPDSDESWEDDWRNILVIEVYNKHQLTWHLQDEEMHLFSGLPQKSYVWDGHTTAAKYAKLIKYFIQGEPCES